MEKAFLGLLFLSLASVGTAFAQAGPYQFYALTPCRVVDTRNATGTTGGPILAANATRDFPMRGNCGIPVTAKAVTVNIAVVSPNCDSFLSVFPSGTTRPVVSTINFSSTDSAVANGAIVPISTNSNDLSIYNACGTVHAIVDVTGYFQ